MESATCQSTGLFSNMISGAIQALLLYQCALVDPGRWPMDRSTQLLRDGFQNYDFVIVGAGSAGCVLANRLSENPAWKILLIEAGEDPPAESDVPALSTTMMDSDVDWRYETEVEKNACLGSRGGRCFIPRGKLLGGSSSINTMLYARGNKKDYDDWEAVGNTGWNYTAVLKYFKKSENFDDPDSMEGSDNAKYHSKGGYLNVAKFNYSHYMHDVVTSAAIQAGHNIVDDTSGEDQIGFTKLYGTLRDGSRHSAANAFLEPAKERANLHILKGTTVQKILLEATPQKRATGIVLKMRNGKMQNINVDKEVILSAGSINSPQLLMLSGIGPEAHLKELGISVFSDLSVGENYQDHIGTLITYSYPKENVSGPGLPYLISQYLETRKGPYAGGMDTSAFLDTTNTGNKQPDVQFEVLYIDSLDRETGLHVKARLNDELVQSYERIVNETNILLFVVVLMRPKSRGTLKLRTSNPDDKPILFGKYLTYDEDRQTLIRGIDEVLKLESTPSFMLNGVKLQKVDYAACDVFQFNSRNYWYCVVKHFTIAVYHPVGTVKMGPLRDSTAVVDPRLRVHGIANLRVIDSSIFPNIVCGNTNAPTMMIAEKGADMIKEDWNFPIY